MSLENTFAEAFRKLSEENPDALSSLDPGLQKIITSTSKSSAEPFALNTVELNKLKFRASGLGRHWSSYTRGGGSLNTRNPGLEKLQNDWTILSSSVAPLVEPQQEESMISMAEGMGYVISTDGTIVAPTHMRDFLLRTAKTNPEIVEDFNETLGTGFIGSPNRYFLIAVSTLSGHNQPERLDFLRFINSEVEAEEPDQNKRMLVMRLRAIGRWLRQDQQGSLPS